MLIALVFGLYTLFGGGSIDSLLGGLSKKEVRAVVADEERAAQVLEWSQALQDGLQEDSNRLKKRIEELRGVHTDYASLPIDFEAQAEHIDVLLEARHERQLKTRSALKQLLNEDEWDALLADR